MNQEIYAATLMFALMPGTVFGQGVDMRLQDGAFAPVLAHFEASASEPWAPQMQAMVDVHMGRQDRVLRRLRDLPFAALDCDAGESGATHVAAADWLLAIASDRRVVMLNENHFHVAARLFLFESLPALREAGFTHLALEAFEPDSTFLEPGSGGYTREPIFAAVIRRATALGFELVAYEFAGESIESREAGQADHLQRAIEHAGEDARFIVFAGWSHILERPDTFGRRWMAARFRDESGIDPFTVDLTSCMHKSASPRDARVALDPDGAALVHGQQYAGGVDAQIQLPIPLELAPGFYRQALGSPTPVELPEVLDEPVLVRAWSENAESVPVPVDQIFVLPGEEAVLYLPPGSYELTVNDGDGATLSRKMVSVP
ncbi:MAG: hypothetical protein WD081_04210 [Gammaproteobacteria bacterium]